MEPDKLKTAKLAMEADGNIIGNCFIMAPDPDLKKKLGVLFGIVEIYNNNDAFIDALWEAINDLKTEYYLPPFNLERGIEKRFEEAIARTNRRIKTAVNQSVEEVDLRNLSAILGIVYDSKVYLTSVGRIKGLFARRKKNGEPLIADILNNSQEKRFRPEIEKIFANIISGELEESDAILCLNEEFLGLFSQAELVEIALDNSALETIKNLETALQEKVAKKNFYAIAIKPEIEATTPTPEKEAVSSTNHQITQPIDNNHETTAINTKIQAAKKTAQPQKSIDRLLYTQVKTEKYLNPSTLPNWQKILLISWNWLKRTAQKTKLLTYQVTVSGWKKLSLLINQRKNKHQPLMADSATVKPLEATNEVKELEKNETKNQTDPIDEFGQNESLNISEITADEKSRFNEPDSILNNTKTNNPPFNGTGLSDKINNFINGKITTFLNLKKIQQAVMVVLLLLLFIFGQSIVMIGRSLEVTGGALGYEKIVKQIEDQLNSAEAQNIFNDEAGALQALKKAEELLTEIPDRRTTKTLKNNLQEKIQTASRNLQRINYQGNPIVLADFNSADSLIGVAKTGKVFWSFDNQNKTFLRLDTLTDKLETITSSLPTIKKIVSLDSKSFLLLTKGNETYKYETAKNSASKITPTKDYFYLKKYESKSNLIIPPLASSTIELSMANDNYLLFLDPTNQRLVILDKTGILKRQFVSPILASTTAFASNFSEKKIWAFADNKIYQLEIDF